jgi:hypothetical protein
MERLCHSIYKKSFYYGLRLPLSIENEVANYNLHYAIESFLCVPNSPDGRR